MLIEAKRRAAAKGIEFSLVEGDIRVPTHCPVLGIPLFVGEGHMCPNSPTLDRIDPTRGYTPDNVAVISFRANAIKHNATAEEVKKVYKWITTQL